MSFLSASFVTSISAALRSRTVSAVIMLAVIAGALLAVPAIANAAPYPPTGGCSLSTGDSTVAPGERVTITGSGFPALATVQLSVESSGSALGSVTTDADGSFTSAVTVPSNVSGAERIVASSRGTSCLFGLSGPAGAPASGSSDGSANSATATTGVAAISATLAALALLGGGLAFLVLGRRRRSS
jgi:hypothetical protein